MARHLHIRQAIARVTIRRVTVGLAGIGLLAILLVSPLTLAPALARGASTYSCALGTSSSGHCYALMQWDGAVDGSNTAITVNHLYTPSGVDGFVDDEMWLDQSNADCPWSGSVCWVEAGITSTSDGSDNSHYFWADSRPIGGGFNSHDLGLVPSADYGGNAGFVLAWDSSGCHCTSTWDVSIYTPTEVFYAYSTDNPISPNIIQVGTELAGSGGSSAPSAYFTYNEYEENTTWYYQNEANYGGNTGWKNFIGGSNQPYYGPPYGEVYVPAEGASNYGGTILTWCC